MDAPVLKDIDNISYTRHEFHHEPEKVQGDLLTLVYDIPYLGACGVFPPLHIANITFSSGGGDAGMSPGASWEPFTLSEKQYKQLLERVLNESPEALKDKARFYHIPFITEPSFDHIQDREEWLKVVCKKHRKRYHSEIDKLQKSI
ncbi:hypothetical protein [Kangiella shandongensis]|uniref:hypothetical protein n=1 Tax=Kangiella shandongensis TaxID=2763258 RepID=UPI001CC07171|nr:hypothetical protein [Kangiella shandongensis]